MVFNGLEPLCENVLHREAQRRPKGATCDESIKQLKGLVKAHINTVTAEY